jgi:Jumonji helical domain
VKRQNSRSKLKMAKGNRSKDVGMKEQKGNDGERIVADNVRRRRKETMKKVVKVVGSGKVTRKAIVAKTKRMDNVGRRSEGGRCTEVGKGISKEVCARVPIPKVMYGRGFGYLYNKEVVKFRTKLAVESFPIAGVEFNKNFKCSYDLNRKLVRRDSTRINSDNKTYTFTCGCGRTDLVLLFRLFKDNIKQALEQKEFLYHVFVKEENYEEALLHFNYSFQQEKKTMKKKNALEGIICNRRAVGRIGRVVAERKNSGVGRTVDERYLLYSHRNVEKFFEVAKFNNCRNFVNRRQMGREEKVQYVSDGSLLSYESLRNGVLTLQYPIFVTDVPESIGLKVNFVKGRKTSDSIRKIAAIVGEDMEVTVINVADQKARYGWTIGMLANYFGDEDRLKAIDTSAVCNREDGIGRRMRKTTEIKILNQVSFEFSCTPLADLVKAPEIVRQIDWIQNAWPDPYEKPKGSVRRITRNTRHNKRDTIYYPFIQYYCVTSSAGAYMDFHIDIGGTSFWYYVVSGSKDFLLIEPTEENIVQYELWACTEMKEEVFFPDVVEDKSTIIHMSVNENETIIVPSGWIHGVYSSMDSLVVGGNFLHGHSAEMQIKINEMECRAVVEAKYRCPYFNITNIFAANMYINKLELMKESGASKAIMSVKEVEQLAYLLVYVEAEYKSNMRCKCNGKLEEQQVVQESEGRVYAFGNNGNYNSVYDVPHFEDAVKYVIRKQNCVTWEAFLEKLQNVMATVRNGE